MLSSIAHIDYSGVYDSVMNAMDRIKSGQVYSSSSSPVSGSSVVGSSPANAPVINIPAPVINRSRQTKENPRKHCSGYQIISKRKLARCND